MKVDSPNDNDVKILSSKRVNVFAISSKNSIMCSLKDGYM